MKTIEEVSNYMDLFERYHPEYSPEDLKQLTVSLLSKLPEREKRKFMNEYYEYLDNHYKEQFPEEYSDEDEEELDDYFEVYKKTNEGS